MNQLGQNQHPEGPYAAGKRRLAELKSQARAAAARRDWATNHKLCDEHDRIALELMRGRNGSLTKRIGNVEKLTPFFLPANVWLGISVVDQKEADRDIPKLLALPADKRFVSYEPALGPIDFSAWPQLDWIIVGGESRQGKALARPFNLDWARAARDHCKKTGTAFFMKQTGSDTTALYERVQKDRAGANPDEWPEDIRIREFPK